MAIDNQLDKENLDELKEPVDTGTEDAEPKDDATESDDDAADEGQSDDATPKKPGQMVPASALVAIRRKLQEFTKLGLNPQQISEALQERDTLRTPKEPPTDAERRREKIREQLFEVLPEMKEILEQSKVIPALQETVIEQNFRNGSAHLAKLLSSNGIKIDAGERKYIERYLSTQMTDQEYNKLARGDVDVLEDVLTRELKRPLLRALKQTSEAARSAVDTEDNNDNKSEKPRGSPPTPPKRVGSGGNTPAKANDKAESARDVHNKAFAAWRGVRK